MIESMKMQQILRAPKKYAWADFSAVCAVSFVARLSHPCLTPPTPRSIVKSIGKGLKAGSTLKVDEMIVEFS